MFSFISSLIEPGLELKKAAFKPLNIGQVPSSNKSHKTKHSILENV